MWNRLIIIVVLLFSVIGAVVISEPEGIEAEEGDAADFYNKTYIEHQTQLERDLFFRGYRTKKRPVVNASTPTEVDVHWHLIHASIDQKEQTMTLHGHLYMTWLDELLGWNPEDYNGIRLSRCNKWQVWHPKVKVANSVSGVHSNFEISSKAHVLLQTQGKDKGAKVEMYPTFSIKVGCNFDYSDYPNDINSCAVSLFTPQKMNEVILKIFGDLPATIAFGWGKQSDKMIISDFNFRKFETSLAYFYHGNFSTLEPITAQERASTWSVMRIELTFARHSVLFGVSVLLPSLVAVLFNILPFFLPSLSLGLYCLVANTVLQAVFLQDLFVKLPLVVNSLPKAVCLYAETMLLNTLAIALHIFFLFVRDTKTQPPTFLTCLMKMNFLVSKNEKNAEFTWKTVISILRILAAFAIFFIYLMSLVVFNF